MDLKTKKLLEYLDESLNNLDVSGFELLEILDTRSQVALREPLMNDDEKNRLEKLDRHLLEIADCLVRRISEIADLVEMRKRAHVLPSHWWWYLDEWNFIKRKIAAV